MICSVKILIKQKLNYEKVNVKLLLVSNYSKFINYGAINPMNAF